MTPRVLDGHRVPGERHHAGAAGTVPGIERSKPQGIGRGVVEQCIFDQAATPAVRTFRGRDCPPNLTPLCRGYLKDSAPGPVGRTPYFFGAVGQRPAGFPEVSIPARSLVPERFRGPVAPSAAATKPHSPAPDARDGQEHGASRAGTQPRKSSRGAPAAVLARNRAVGPGPGGRLARVLGHHQRQEVIELSLRCNHDGPARAKPRPAMYCGALRRSRSGKGHMKRIFAFVSAVTFVASATLAHAAADNCPNGGTVRFGVEPYEAASRIIPIYSHIGDLMVRSSVARCKPDHDDYTAEIEAMRAGRLEVGESGLGDVPRIRLQMTRWLPPRRRGG